MHHPYWRGYRCIALLAWPTFPGVVHVDFWVFGFDIHFGSGELPQAVDWDSFWDMICQVNAQDPTSSNTAGPNAKLVHALQAGAVPSKGQVQTKRLGTVDLWLIRAGSFSFEVQSRFPLTRAVVNDTEKASRSELLATDYTKDNIYSKPMQISDPCELFVTIEGVPDAFRLKPKMKSLPRMKSLPKAIWGACKFRTVLESWQRLFVRLRSFMIIHLLVHFHHTYDTSLD